MITRERFVEETNWKMSYEDEIPACIKICEALGIKTVSYEWSKDYYGRQNSDEIKLTYTI